MIRTYDSHYRGECRSERCEQIDAMGWLEKNYPAHYALAFHCPSETKASPQHMQMRAKEGVRPGVPDIIVMLSPCGLFEMKRLNSKKSRPTKEQIAMLEAADAQGHFTAICYGSEQFKLAYMDYLDFCSGK